MVDCLCSGAGRDAGVSSSFTCGSASNGLKKISLDMGARTFVGRGTGEEEKDG
jgi:hypothetical protein